MVEEFGYIASWNCVENLRILILSLLLLLGRMVDEKFDGAV